MIKALKAIGFILAVAVLVVFVATISGAVIYKHYIMPNLPTVKIEEKLEKAKADASDFWKAAKERTVLLKEAANRLKRSIETIQQRDARIEQLEEYITDNGLPIPAEDEPTLATPIPIEVR